MPLILERGTNEIAPRFVSARPGAVVTVAGERAYRVLV